MPCIGMILFRLQPNMILHRIKSFIATELKESAKASPSWQLIRIKAS